MAGQRRAPVHRIWVLRTLRRAYAVGYNAVLDGTALLWPAAVVRTCAHIARHTVDDVCVFLLTCGSPYVFMKLSDGSQTPSQQPLLSESGIAHGVMQPCPLLYVGGLARYACELLILQQQGCIRNLVQFDAARTTFGVMWGFSNASSQTPISCAASADCCRRHDSVQWHGGRRTGLAKRGDPSS